MLKSTRVNAICPYYTMFPLEFPVATLARTQSTGWVLDPFCGRGTTNFAARLAGRPSIGVDASPVAVAITKSKQVSVRPERVIAAAKSVLASFSPSEIRTPTGEFWRWAYHGTTLKQLCGLRAALLKDCRSDVRVALRAIILGALHGPLTKGPASHFSNQMPRTFAPKPRYASRFWISRRMPPIRVDVLGCSQAHQTERRGLAHSPERDQEGPQGAA